VRILGVDPGLIRTGYGVIEVTGGCNMKLIEAGVIRTTSGERIAKRLTDIFQNLTDVIQEHRPEVLVLEKIYSHYKHPATAILMGHARGVVCLVSGLNNIQLVNYAASRIKKAVTGNGRATKTQVQQTVKAMLGLKKAPDPVDISDALAIAMSFVYIEGNREKTNKLKVAGIL